MSSKSVRGSEQVNLTENTIHKTMSNLKVFQDHGWLEINSDLEYITNSKYPTSDDLAYILQMYLLMWAELSGNRLSYLI